VRRASAAGVNMQQAVTHRAHAWPGSRPADASLPAACVEAPSASARHVLSPLTAAATVAAAHPGGTPRCCRRRRRVPRRRRASGGSDGSSVGHDSGRARRQPVLAGGGRAGAWTLHYERSRAWAVGAPWHSPSSQTSELLVGGVGAAFPLL